MDQETRRKRLQSLVDAEGRGGTEAVARRIERSPSQLSDMLNGRKAFGEKVARHIEAKLGLPRLWLDDESMRSSPPPPATDPWPFTLSRAEFDRLTLMQRGAIDKAIHELAESFAQQSHEVRRRSSAKS